MSQFLSYFEEDIGFWVKNGEWELLLEWLSLNRFRRGDPRHEICRSDDARLYPNLNQLFPAGEGLTATAAELERAGQKWPYLPQIIELAGRLIAGTWRPELVSSDANWWRVPWGGFTFPGAWSGECIDLHIDFPPPSTGNLVSAAAALWSHEHLQGCWLSKDEVPTREKRVAPAVLEGWAAASGLAEFGDAPALYGFGRVLGRFAVPCAVHLGIGESHPFLVLSIRAPHLRGLPPEIAGEGAWSRKLFEWLAEIGRHVHGRVSIRWAVVGWEPPVPTESQLREREFDPRFGYLLPGPQGWEVVPPTLFTPK